MMFIEVLGWLGAVAVLWAFYLINSGKTDNKSKLYQWLNLAGAVFLIVNTVYLKAYPSAFVNIVWLFIAIYGLLKKDSRP